MSGDFRPGLRAAVRHELEALHKDWPWYLALGIALIILGTFALGYAVLATAAVVLTLGVVLLLAGVTEAVGAFWTHRWSGFFVQLLTGAFYAVLGLMFLRRPLLGAEALTLLLGSLLLVVGLFRIVAAASLRYPSWGWSVLSGVITTALGLMIWAGWPALSLVILGTFLGIEMIFAGWTWIALALMLRKLPKAAERAREAAAPAEKPMAPA